MNNYVCDMVLDFEALFIYSVRKHLLSPFYMQAVC